MAHSRSARKRIVQNARARARNRWRKRRIRGDVKDFLKAVHDGDPEKAKEAYREATKALDQVAAKGTIHKNAAARRKSRLAKRLNEMKAAHA